MPQGLWFLTLAWAWAGHGVGGVGGEIVKVTLDSLNVNNKYGGQKLTGRDRWVILFQPGLRAASGLPRGFPGLPAAHLRLLELLKWFLRLGMAFLSVR